MMKPKLIANVIVIGTIATLLVLVYKITELVTRQAYNR